MMPNIAVSAKDFERIENLLDGLSKDFAPVRDRLFNELGRADVIEPELVPPTLVTMNSRVRFTVLSTDASMIRRLVYPRDQAADPENISLLTPMGSALLGLSVGQEIEWQIPGSKNMRVRIDAIEYQPEAAGDYTL
jgi:regulator of nucleoside diphosphate kinase